MPIYSLRRVLIPALFFIFFSVHSIAGGEIVYPSRDVLSFCQISGCDNQVFYRFYEAHKKRFCYEREVILNSERQSEILSFVLRQAISSPLPTTVAVIPILESSLDPHATASSSKNAAKGLWQMKPYTAKDMGLEVGRQVDERLDVEKSTKAGLKYVLWLENKFDGDHNLAVLAYHVGIGRVKKMIEEHYTRNPWFLSKLISDHRPDRDYLLKYYSYSLALMDKGCQDES
jgi:hypothetical protein